MAPIIKNISDTALWVAVFRADENDRGDALFHDPFARRLAGGRGAEIAGAIEFCMKNSWSFVARTFLIDEIIRKHVQQGFDLILNLAAGLDTRAYRLNLPSSLNWVEVDVPEIIEYKTKMLENEKPVCGLRSIQLDLGDREGRIELFNQLGREAKRALVISEGLMIYLKEEDVGTLADDLSAQKNFRRWVFDLASPGLLQIAQKEMGSFFKEGDPAFKFAPEEGERYYLRHGWKNIESHSMLKTAAVINRLSDEMMNYAAIPEPEGPKGAFPWSGVCLFENMNKEGS